MTDSEKSVVVAITGASGVRYGLRLLSTLLEADYSVNLMISEAGHEVLRQECNLNWQSQSRNQSDCEEEREITRQVRDYFDQKHLYYFHNENWSSPLASGSGGATQMVICPCSMSTLAAVANGLSNTLIQRAADVMIKERRRLVLVPRETPLSAIHLNNMLTLARLNVDILPASPGFYNHPADVDALVDFIVGRILDRLDIKHALMPAWGQG